MCTVDSILLKKSFEGNDNGMEVMNQQVDSQQFCKYICTEIYSRSIKNFIIIVNETIQIVVTGRKKQCRNYYFGYINKESPKKQMSFYKLYIHFTQEYNQNKTKTQTLIKIEMSKLKEQANVGCAKQLFGSFGVNRQRTFQNIK
eukprot:TRINITY_DN30457_c0_g2_i1.p4 TRINITY_DN30457_c0_g2~~TRINITY_DN30457_c0_g2_i1.p4  ORF type:complete len:144 (-),score=0.51 TRINITY_DN30457_c0_g2_i1:299-730(-)